MSNNNINNLWPFSCSELFFLTLVTSTVIDYFAVFKYFSDFFVIF